MPARPRLLVVDDSSVDRERVLRLLGRAYASREASTAAAALASTYGARLDCVLLDYRLPDADGLSTLDALVERGLPVVMLTGQGDERIAVEAMKRGAQDYLSKSSLDRRALTRSIEHAIQRVGMQRQIDAQRRELEARLAELAMSREELARKNLALREREAELRVILGQLPAVVWTTDRALRLASVTGDTGVLGLESGAPEGRPLEEALASWRLDGVIEAHATALTGTHGTFLMERDGRTLEGRAEPLRDGSDGIDGLIGVALDVTEARELERQLRHAQKMEALGQLAGGVAHDFNNLLTAIVSFTEFARDALADADPARSDLEEVLAAAGRGAELVRKLLAFSRSRVERPRAVDLNRLVGGLGPMLQRLVGEDVTIDLDLEETLPPTVVDSVGVEQIVVNLAVNARDAMSSGGHLLFSTRSVSLDEHLADGRAGIDPGDYVVLAVSDDGPGIPEPIRERIFEPFFSTKGAAQGSGLGLSTCYGIARKAGGGIGVYSEIGRGTTFRVYLPACSEAPTVTRAASPVAAPAANGEERVLVIEDDRQVQRAVMRTLRRAGYHVIAATSAAEARRVAEREGRAIDLVLSDVVMPELAGPELVESLREWLPEARVLFMSGYTGGALKRRALVHQSDAVLEKPFSSDELARAIRSVLDAQDVER